MARKFPHFYRFLGLPTTASAMATTTTKEPAVGHVSFLNFIVSFAFLSFSDSVIFLFVALFLVVVALGLGIGGAIGIAAMAMASTTTMDQRCLRWRRNCQLLLCSQLQPTENEQRRGTLVSSII